MHEISACRQFIQANRYRGITRSHCAVENRLYHFSFSIKKLNLAIQRFNQVEVERNVIHCGVWINGDIGQPIRLLSTTCHLFCIGSIKDKSVSLVFYPCGHFQVAEKFNGMFSSMVYLISKLTIDREAIVAIKLVRNINRVFTSSIIVLFLSRKLTIMHLFVSKVDIRNDIRIMRI